MTKRSYIFIFFILLFIKINVSLYIYYFVGNQFFGGGNDANYYHQYAVGLIDNAVNLWPVLLRWLNNHLYYDRGFITLILTILGILIIPFMVARLAVPDKKSRTYFDRKNYWIVAVIIALYPTLYYQTTDMYRDVFMLFLFLFFLGACKSLSNNYNFFIFIFAIGLSYLLFLFRPYLGIATFLTLLIAPFYSFKRLPIVPILICYFTLLLLLYHFSYLDRVTMGYRSNFDDILGGSNLNIRFTDSYTFIPKFILSAMYQIFGTYIYDIKSLFIFLTESLFIIIIFIYILKNKAYSIKFIDYLFIFSLAYSTAWILGNDNLGTATRIRIFNYIVFLIMFFIIRGNKLRIKNNRGINNDKTPI